ncbi:MAG: C39 family peptidase [Brevinematales bacterium]
MSKKYAGYGSSSPTKEEKKKQEEIEDKLSKSSSDKLKHLGIENSEQKDVINENTKQLGMNITEEQKSIFDKEYKKYIENSIMEGKEIKNRTRNYILSLREKGIDRSLIKDYLTVLDSLSDLTVLNNYNSFKFSDKNQRNNLTNVDDKELGYRTGNVMCFPTSVAIALSNLGIENPVAALGIQFEDHLDDLIRNDPKIMKEAKKYPAYKPRTIGAVEELMINRYFGDRVIAKVEYKEPAFKNIEGAKSYLKRLNEDYLSKGVEVVMGTRLTHGGHVVVYSGYDEGGIYITDPYGKASLIKGSNGNSGYDKNLTDIGETTKGYNVYVPWNKVKEFLLGYKWYMTIELK